MGVAIVAGAAGTRVGMAVRAPARAVGNAVAAGVARMSPGVTNGSPGVTDGIPGVMPVGPTGVGLGAGKAVCATGTLAGVAMATPAGLVGTTAGAGRVASCISVGVGFDTKGR